MADQSAALTTPQPIKREDYTPPAWLVDMVDLTFELTPEATTVTSTLSLHRNPDSTGSAAPITLDGEALTLISVTLDGATLGESDYDLTDETLTIQTAATDAVQLTIVSNTIPADNTRLEGLYMSGPKDTAMFCTQCEAEGFRRITYFPDRPDVMSRYRVTMRADKSRYPVLLSNGNLESTRELESGRHEAVWTDPHPKPCYLFALVAGDLDHIEDKLTTMEGRNVTMRLYTEKGKSARATYALDALKRSMIWDEEVYGRAYDLDLFNIVAVSHFNMGAMENKSLNVFNDKYILADANTATDSDYAFIESVVAHEYFHNWSGNRVTCRDWFQLSLKEGFTVFRDQQFSADMRSAPVQRIGDVRMLRARQFPEDAGPLAHPVRPDEFVEINNFYTATVYEKGAELIRMLHRLLGPEGFRKGSDLYFDRHDGQAVTCDDFISAMEDATATDLTRFKRWYGQAGTPTLHVTEDWDNSKNCLTLTLTQETKPTPGQPRKQALVLPLDIGLMDETTGAQVAAHTGQMDEATTILTFDGLSARPAVSLNRGFAAPVNIQRTLDDDHAALLMSHDQDPFARWEAGQDFALRHLFALVDNPAHDPAPFSAAYGAALADDKIDTAYKAELLSLPGFDMVADRLTQRDGTIDVDAIDNARQTLLNRLAIDHEAALLALYHSLSRNEAFSPDAAAAGRRALRGLALGLVTRLSEHEGLALQHFDSANNMTDRMIALGALNRIGGADRTAAMQAFHDRYENDANALDKWFGLSAQNPAKTALDDVKKLMDHPGFSMTNPNRFRALIGPFVMGNPVNFHAADGSGYQFLAQMIIALDPINPQTAARFIAPLGQWKRHTASRQKSAKAALQTILSQDRLSRDVRELAQKAISA
ncbi:MAG: aminopeptidase N [Alphaproteobacteria bacterium]